MTKKISVLIPFRRAFALFKRSMSLSDRGTWALVDVKTAKRNVRTIRLESDLIIQSHVKVSSKSLC